jgi:hypothetical protein
LLYLIFIFYLKKSSFDNIELKLRFNSKNAHGFAVSEARIELKRRFNSKNAHGFAVSEASRA